MKIIEGISFVVLGLYYALLIAKIVLPKLVSIDASWVVGFVFSIILLYAAPIAVLAIILICVSLFRSYKRERVKPRASLITFLLALSILPVITATQLVRVGIQSQKSLEQVTKVENAKADLSKKLLGNIVLNSVAGERIKEFQVHDNYAYILSIVDTFYNPAYSSYLNIVDVSNPSAPMNKARISLNYDRTARMVYSDNKVYIFDTKNTFIVDVSNKEKPKALLDMHVPDNVALISFVKDDKYLYTADAIKGVSGGNYVNISEVASNAQRWRKFDLGGNYPRDIYAKDGYFYSFFTEGKPTYGVSKLSVIDATNLNNIQEVKTIGINLDPNSMASKIAVSGNYLYLQSEVRTYTPSLSTATLITVLDISDPKNVTQVGKLEIKEPSFPGGYNISISGNYLFFENKIINIINPRNPVIEKELTGFTFPAESVSGGYFYNLAHNQDADNIDIYNLADVFGQK